MTNHDGIFGPELSKLLIERGVVGSGGWWGDFGSGKFVYRKLKWTSKGIPAISLYDVIRQSKKVWGEEEVIFYWKPFEGKTMMENCRSRAIQLVNLISDGSSWFKIEEWMLQSLPENKEER